MADESFIGAESPDRGQRVFGKFSSFKGQDAHVAKLPAAWNPVSRSRVAPAASKSAPVDSPATAYLFFFLPFRGRPRLLGFGMPVSKISRK